ncbi:class I SAM-dependent methyltransferase [Paenibacillus sp. P46E]|uniref:class I SAM-dependent methyltransferase n=1 Tax=Paenibacillus sp. P46E TaxID=1349436 RepID=UPI00093C47D8|nr:class I SAM-dependent methyltransferase [Paenibacillus sp. P46E]OKP98635.1 hypothetical protein A3849_08900 [Paenibacillus sp. P46E]
MQFISDSSAIEKDRLLAQHQAALTLLQRALLNPTVNEYKWLDLACGRGQIINHLHEVLERPQRQKISYHGYDIKVDYIAITEKKAENLDLCSVQVQVGQMEQFPTLNSPEVKYDFITFTNTAHEIDFRSLPIVLIEGILRLNDTGCLFVYDMEKLPDLELELGAITWSREEIQELVEVILTELGVTGGLQFPTGRWKHSTVYGWNIQLHREYLGLTDDEINESKGNTIEKSIDKLVELLRRKYISTKSALDAMTKYGPGSKEEATQLQRYLYDFYSLSRALEVIA